MPIDYSKGKIYCIRSHQTNEVYIGSTIQTLSERLRGHRRGYKCYLAGNKNFISSFRLLKYDDYYIELIEDCPCDNKSQLERREGQVIRATENCVNMVIAGRTKKEYRVDNKEYYNKQQKEYRDARKEQKAKYDKTYRELNKQKISERKKQKVKCICGSVVCKDGLSAHRKTLKHQNFLKSQENQQEQQL